MSNALKIARRLKLPRDLIRRAHRYLRRRQRRAPELARLQQVREQAEKARQDALLAQHEAERQRREYEEKTAAVAREAAQAAALRKFRAELQPDALVRVPRFDRPGRVLRVDHKRGMVVVSVGRGQWQISLEEVFPAADSDPFAPRP